MLLALIWPRPLAGIAVVVAWGLLGAAAAQPRPDVTLWIPTDSITEEESFALTIEGSTPAHRGIAFPPATADSAFGDLEVLDRSDVHTRRVGGGYAIDSVSYTVRTSARDSVRIPPVPIRVDAAVGTLTTFTEPRTVRVHAGRLSPALRPFRGESPNALGWFVLAVVVAGAFYGAARLWGGVRDEKASPEESSSESSPASSDADPSPYEDALQQLRALRSRDRTDPATVEAVHVALADAVRAYLSRRWDVAAEERTTAELLDVLARRPDVPPDVVQPLRTALEQSDRVKFAAARPDSAATDAALDNVKAALDRLEEASSPSSEPPIQSE